MKDRKMEDENGDKKLNIIFLSSIFLSCYSSFVCFVYFVVFLLFAPEAERMP